MQFPNLFGTHPINSKWQIQVLWMVTVPSINNDTVSYQKVD